MPNELSGNRVLVVGGGGFIGRHVVNHLLAANAKVIVLDMVPSPIEHSELNWVVGNVTDETLFSSVAANCDTIVYLASSSLPASSSANLSSEVGSHVQQTIKAAEICEAQNVKRFLFASSGGTVYGVDSDQPLDENSQTIPKTAYGVSKLSIEHYLRIIGLRRSMETVSLRIANPYGEWQRAYRSQGFIAATLDHATSGQTMSIWGDGSVERDFIYVGDVARAFVAACDSEAPPSIVNIGSGKSTSLLKVINLAEKIIGRKVKVNFEKERLIDVHKNALNIDRAKITLNWQPMISLEEGLANTAIWWEDHAHKK